MRNLIHPISFSYESVVAVKAATDDDVVEDEPYYREETPSEDFIVSEMFRFQDEGHSWGLWGPSFSIYNKKTGQAIFESGSVIGRDELRSLIKNINFLDWGPNGDSQIVRFLEETKRNFDKQVKPV